MTDLEKLRAVFHDLGIGYSVEEREENGEKNKIIRLEANTHTHTHTHVNGYSGFVAEFIFDENEHSTGVGIWD